MRRRDFAGGLLVTAALSNAAIAQAPVQRRRIALVDTSTSADQLTETTGPVLLKRFFEALRARGYSEGRNLVVERYSAEGQSDRWTELAGTVVSRNPDAIVTNFGLLARVFKTTTATIPIVVMMPDPVGLGLSATLVQPGGGNATVVSFDAGPEVYAKQLQLLKEAIPSAAKVVCMASRVGWEFIVGPSWRRASAQLGLSLIPITTSDGTSAEVHRALTDMAQQRADAAIVSVDVDFLAHRQLIAEAGAKAHVPVMYPFRDYAELGGLMSYGPDLGELGRHLADTVHRVLTGTKPGDIPIYQPTKFELILNQKAANALHLTFSPSLLARADQVIE